MSDSNAHPRKPPQHPLSKEQRARDAALAMQEYEAEKRAAAEKTARLRELRLAREAAIAANPPAPKQKARKKSAS